MKDGNKAKVGIVTVASKVESGGQRGDEITQKASQRLKDAGLDVAVPGFTVWSAEEAQKAVRMLKAAEIDLLVTIHCTWVVDALQFQLVKGLQVPVMLWALPYSETFSLASVQHFGSILHHNDIFYRWCYGLPDDKKIIAEVTNLAGICRAARVYRSVNIGLAGPRPTWRLGGPQDMVYDEWDISNSLGINVIHIEMDDLMARIEKQKAEQAGEVIRQMKAARRYGKMEVGEERIQHSAKVYLAAKEILQQYDLAGMAVECYPYYGGLVNLASSWLADEDIILDPEGDVGHTMLCGLMNELAPGKPVGLAEMVIADWDKDQITLRHEGSAAHSLAEDPSKVEVIPAGDGVGTIVQFPMRLMPQATAASMCGRDGVYDLFTARLSIERISQEAWQAAGGNFQACAKAPEGIRTVVSNAFKYGMDHHWLLKEGDLVEALATVADLWKIGHRSLNQK